MENPIILIRGERINLCLPEKDRHFDKCLRWINDPKINRYLMRGLFPTNKATEENWFARVNSDEKNVVMIIETSAGKPIGTIGLHRIEHLSRKAELGILIGEADEWGKGYATEAEKLIVSYGFETLGLNRIVAKVFDGNIGSLKALLKTGFSQEAIMKQDIYKNGAYLDVHLLALLRNEWEKQ